MCSLEPFKIDLVRLCDADTVFDFSLHDDYFEAIGASEVRKGDLAVRLSVRKAGGRYFDLDFHISGTVTLPCDRCLDDMDVRIEADSRLGVRLGEEYSEDDDVVTVDESEGVIDVSWHIYEFIALNIPVKHVHKPGECNRLMIDMLEEHTAAGSGDRDDEETIDPRWSGLEKLKNNN